MPSAAWAVAGVVLCLTAQAAEPASQAPVYTSDSIVNAATNRPGVLAPLALVSLYGNHLSFVTRGLTPDDIRNGIMPTTLIGSGVTVTIDGLVMPILFVSPTQVNFLIPGNIRPGRRTIRLTRNGLAGPAAVIELADSSPGLFPMENSLAIATRTDGSLVTAAAPATPGDVVVIYAAGLGVTQPSTVGLVIPIAAASISARSQFSVLLNGEPVPDSHILYAGVTPGFPGLYQVNCRIPEEAPANPEIRLRLPGQTSPERLFLPVQSR